MKARPFLKWAGGKRRVLPELLKHVPKNFGAYHEPFLGGGALFFELQPRHSFLSDTNQRLVRTYWAVRDNVRQVIALLKNYPNTKEFYMSMRSRDIDDEDNVEVAAWLIYLNKTGFNGLYRVNKSGIFNVPFGNYPNPTICDENNLLACSEALLKNASVVTDDFEHVLNNADAGDLVYFDPPYIPLSATSSFASYTSDGFGMDDHRRLRSAARVLKQSGVHVILSNSSAPAVEDLYGEGFERHSVQSMRSISSKAASRGNVAEYVIT